MGYKNLAGKVCIVTGSGRGIGRAIATRLCQEGCSVAFADIDQKNAEDAAAEAVKSGGKALAVQVDIADPSSMTALVQKAVAEFGRLDVMFNNAAIMVQADLMELGEADFNKIMRVNALGSLYGIQEAAKQMIKQGGGGKIVNTNSQAGKTAWPGYPAYCASKFVVSAWTQAAARGLAEHKITVNSFAPGAALTPMWNDLAAGFNTTAEEMIKSFEPSVLLGQTQKPEDYGGIACFLASDDSDWITGQTIMIDGGMVFL